VATCEISKVAFTIISYKGIRILPNFSKSKEESSVAEKVRSQLILFLSLCSGVSVPPNPRPTERKKSEEH
jgi:hypothetical protein